MKDEISKSEITVRTVTLTRKDIQYLITREVFGGSWGVMFEWVDDEDQSDYSEVVLTATHKLETKLASDV